MNGEMVPESTHIEIKKTTIIEHCSIRVPASKSESNRALIIKALANQGVIHNLSTARDTLTMDKLLHSKDHTLDAFDAGTTMRFLTAYLAIKGQNRIITGTKRMCERPIGILVEALKQLGANIEYMENDGYPPLHFKGFRSSGTEKIQIRGDISSQYISAILMISPLLENGLILELMGKIGSKPYIDMTLGIMKHFGVSVQFEKNTIYIPPQSYGYASFEVESDWSGASYWYSIAALAPKADIILKGFKLPSLQGDSIIKDIMVDLGVETRFESGDIQLTKSSHREEVQIDFADFPDLAQTIAVVCAVKGIYARMTGLQSLRIKETDRIAALQKELSKLNCQLIERNANEWELIPATHMSIPDKLHFTTYDDHRMAMAFAPIATHTDIILENPCVVQKSYPSFWKDMEIAGFQINSVS